MLHCPKSFNDRRVITDSHRCIRIVNQCYNLLPSTVLNFSFRKIVLPQINLVLKTFGDSTTDCVTEKILTQYLLKCKLSLVNSTRACIFMINLLTKRALICLLDHSNYVKLLSSVLRSAATL